MSEPDPTYWVARPGDDAAGPFTYEQIAGMWGAGSVTADALICKTGSGSWVPLAKAMAAANRADDSPPYNVGVYRVIGLFFGCLGIHNFYAGEVGPGVRKLLISAFGMVLISAGEGLGLIGALLLLFSLVATIFDVIRGRSPINPA